MTVNILPRAVRLLRAWDEFCVSNAVAHWRLRLFRSGLALMAIEIGLYICGIVVLTTVEPVGAKVKVAARLSIIGTTLSLMVLTVSVFGSGWKRVALAVVCLLSLFFWYGLTLY
jgi:hypothetical protein